MVGNVIARATLPLDHIVERAALFNFGSASTERPGVVEDDLARAVVALFDQLAARDIDYLLVGGLALLRYIDGRNTEDVDLVVAASDLERLEGLTIEDRERDFVRARFRGLRVDFLLTENPVFDHVKRHYVDSFTFRGRTIPCSTVAGLVLLKLYALPFLYRQHLFDKVAIYETDVMMLLQAHSVEIDAVFEILKAHLSSGDVETLREIHREIAAKIETRRRRFIDEPE
jgi:hypothetical protein